MPAWSHVCRPCSWQRLAGLLCRGDAESVLLEVRASNQPAQQLYASLGFECVGLRKKYYGDGEDAVLMTLLLRERRMQ